MKFLAVILSVLCLCRCETSETKDRASVQKQQLQYQKSQPIPTFDWSLERDTVIQLYKVRNTQVATYSVWRAASGMIEGDCSSIGYPIQGDVQLTNPLQHDTNGGVVEQAEPNGLFSSKHTHATWVRCVVSIVGVPMVAPTYVEADVTTYPYPVIVDYDKNRVTVPQGVKPSVLITAAQAP